MDHFVIQAFSPDKMEQLEVLLLLEFDVRFLNKKFFFTTNPKDRSIRWGGREVTKNSKQIILSFRILFEKNLPHFAKLIFL